MHVRQVNLGQPGGRARNVKPHRDQLRVQPTDRPSIRREIFSLQAKRLPAGEIERNACLSHLRVRDLAANRPFLAKDLLALIWLEFERGGLHSSQSGDGG